MGCHFPLKIAPSHGNLNPHLMCDSLGPPEFISQTASQSVQTFLHSSQLWQTVRQSTDRPCYSVSSNRPHLRSTEMRPKNGLWLYLWVFSNIYYIKIHIFSGVPLRSPVMSMIHRQIVGLPPSRVDTDVCCLYIGINPPQPGGTRSPPVSWWSERCTDSLVWNLNDA